MPDKRPRTLHIALMLITGIMALCMPPVFAANEAETLPTSKSSIIAPLASASLLLDVSVTDDGIIAVGERGHILLSRDNGTSWNQVKIPTRSTLTAVFFHDTNLGWAVGHDAVILRTTDGGAHWERVYANPELERPLLDVWFKDANYGLAIGAYGLLLATRDGGNTWTQNRVSQDDFHLNHLMANGAGRLYIVAEGGRLYRSDDFGQSWNKLPSPYNGSFFGAVALDSNALLIFGLRGHLYRSSNAGINWRAVKLTTEAMLTSGIRLDDDRIIIVGLAGTVLLSQDRGRSFTLLQQTDRKGISAIAQTRDGSLIIVGEGGVKRLPLSSLPENTAVTDNTGQ